MPHKKIFISCTILLLCFPLLAAAKYPQVDDILRYARDSIKFPSPKWKDFGFPRADVTAPMPELVTFDDLEDPAWEEEVNDIYRQAGREGRKHWNFRVLLLNAALRGNAVAAHELGAEKGLSSDFPEELAALWEPTQWIDFADALTSPGWWHVWNNSQVQLDWQEGSNRHYQIAAQMGHPVGMFALAKNGKKFFQYPKEGTAQPTVQDLVYESARRGLAFAQSRLASPSTLRDEWYHWNDLIKGQSDDVSCAYAKAGAEQGNPYGMVRLGICYSEGLGGLPKDLEAYAMYCSAAPMAAKEKIYPSSVFMDRITPETSHGGRCAALFLEPITPEQYQRAEERAREFIARLKEKRDADFQARQALRQEICQAKLESIWPLYSRLYEILKSPPVLERSSK